MLWIWENFQICVSEQEHLFYGPLAKDKQMSGKCSQTNSYLSAILDRQGLPVAAPVDMRTKNLQGFWYKLKKNNPKIVVMSPTVATKSYQATRSCLATVPFVLGRDRTPNPWRKTLPCFGTRHRKNLVVEEGTISPKKKRGTTANGPSCVEKPKWIFHNLGNLFTTI